jgi:hypothetical protein
VRQISTQPLGDTLGQGRDDDLVEAAITECRADGLERVFLADDPLYRCPSGALEKRECGLEGPVGSPFRGSSGISSVKVHGRSAALFRTVSMTDGVAAVRLATTRTR